MRYQSLSEKVAAKVKRQSLQPSPDILSLEAALYMLTAVVGAKRISRDKEAQLVAPLLCAWLDYHCLGLELVGLYLKENQALSLTQMLERLKAQESDLEIIDFNEPSIPKTQQRLQGGVKATIELIWQKIDPITATLAQFLSLFAPEIIPWKIVEKVQENFLQLYWTKADINRAKKQLCNWKFINRVEGREGCWKIHPLIRQFLQAKLANSEQADEFKIIFVKIMVECSHQIPDVINHQAIESLKDTIIPHLEEVAQNLTAFVKDEDLLWLFDRLGRFYKSQGLYGQAELWFVQCLSMAQDRLGNDHPDVVTTLNNLALLYQAQGRYDEAELIYEEALEMKKHLLESDHPDVPVILNNLALLYHSQGRDSEAQVLCARALELRQCYLGNNHIDVATSLNNLALLHYSQGQYNEAEPLYVQALELRKKLLGNDHPDVATTLSNLALLYYSQGRFNKAQPLLLQALAISEKVLGLNHPNTVIFRENLTNFRVKMNNKNPWWQQILPKTIVTFKQRNAE
jgi:tetratricopeptide (TPR) repeat protein